MSYQLRLFTLGATFAVQATHEVASIADARVIVEAHIAESGYTNLRTKDDEEGNLRFIADPAKGRKGRNVASMDIY